MTHYNTFPSQINNFQILKLNLIFYHFPMLPFISAVSFSPWLHQPPPAILFPLLIRYFFLGLHFTAHFFPKRKMSYSKLMGVLIWFHDNETCLNWIKRLFSIPHPLPCTPLLFPSPTCCSIDIHNTETLEMNHFPWIATGHIFFFWSFNCKSASRQMETNKAYICFIIKQVLLH